MQQFNFYYGVALGQLILSQCDNLSRTLQKSTISAAEGQAVAALTVKTLSSIRSDENFDLFWAKTMKAAEALDISERKRKVPRRIDDGNAAEAEHHSSPCSYYKQLYFEGLDLTINCIKSRFEQEGYVTYCNLLQFTRYSFESCTRERLFS